MRVIHSADWHLGHCFHGLDRAAEQDAFLDWLLGEIETRAADALIVAGDLFDGQNPPVAAVSAFYRFLAAAKHRCPALDILVIAGNHDSGGRLAAPAPLLDAFGIRIVGVVPRDPDGAVRPDRLVVPLARSDGTVAAWCAAVPYLRPADLPAPAREPDDPAGEDPLVEGVRRLYADAVAAARPRRAPGQALIATGHCYMQGGRLSELSERKILGGNLHALPVDLFANDLSYVALGHLHRAQAVGERAHVRYSGAPYALAVDEAAYPHQILVLDFDGDRLAHIEPVRVPRFIDVIRLPGPDGAERAEVLAALAALPPADRPPPATGWPYLEVTVRLGAPDPRLRADVEAAVRDKAVRLVKLAVVAPDAGDADEADRTTAPHQDLAELKPDEVFRRCYRRHDPERDPDPALVAAFHDLVEAAQASDLER